MVRHTPVQVAGLTAPMAAAGTTPVGAGAVAVAVVESGFHLRRLRLHAAAAAVMVALVTVVSVTVVSVTVASVTVVSVIVVGSFEKLAAVMRELG